MRKIGQHQTAREELNKAANICLFVKENCGNAETARYMSEAIDAINEAVASLPAPGNAAAMRAALEYVCHMDDNGYTSYDVRVAIQKAHDALAAPARNCDKYGMDDVKGMDADFGAFCQQYGAKDGENCVGCPIKHMDNLCCHAAWMLLAAEGGAE